MKLDTIQKILEKYWKMGHDLKGINCPAEWAVYQTWREVKMWRLRNNADETNDK